MSEDRAVLLYGSHARGDADAMSDVDVLVIGETLSNVCEVAELLPSSCRGPLHVSHYTWMEFGMMSKYGSLFLHHLAAEARAIRYDGDARRRSWEMLASLRPYQLAERDLRAFRATLADVKVGLRMGLPACFELAVLGGVARHASVLGCYLAGSPTFGRKSISRAAEVLGIQQARADLELAHRFRLFEDGRCDPPSEETKATVGRVLEALTSFLDRLEVLIHANAA